jgi:hypothetical protein
VDSCPRRNDHASLRYEGQTDGQAPRRFALQNETRGVFATLREKLALEGEFCKIQGKFDTRYNFIGKEL